MGNTCHQISLSLIMRREKANFIYIDSRKFIGSKIYMYRKLELKTIINYISKQNRTLFINSQME